MKSSTLCLAASLATLICAAGSANAGIVYVGGVGDTVYGVAPYALPAQAFPVFGANNVTGFNDVLLSPGHGFLIASPVIANNISQTGIQPLGLYSFQIGGVNGVGAFGAGQTLITGPRVGFGLTDSAPGGGTASYSISSWTTNYLVTPGGFAGNLGTYLSIGGRLPAASSAAVASLVSDYYINNVLIGQTPALVLAAAGNGNFQAVGGSGAALVFGGGGTYRGLAIDNVAATLLNGARLKVVSTLTEYADPASIDSIAPDLSLLPGDNLGDFTISDVAGGVPEPAAWSLMLIGVGAMGARLRRSRAMLGAVA